MYNTETVLSSMNKEVMIVIIILLEGIFLRLFGKLQIDWIYYWNYVYEEPSLIAK